MHGVHRHRCRKTHALNNTKIKSILFEGQTVLELRFFSLLPEYHACKYMLPCLVPQKC